MWKGVVWSDESKFNILKSDGLRTCIRRRGSENFDKDCVIGMVKHGIGSVIIVWCCICGDHTGMLL